MSSMFKKNKSVHCTSVSNIEEKEKNISNNENYDFKICLKPNKTISFNNVGPPIGRDENEVFIDYPDELKVLGSEEIGAILTSAEKGINPSQGSI